MKKLLLAAAILGSAILPATAGTSVSLTIGEPGFYGRIDIGGMPPPPVIVATPVIIEPVRVSVAPVYLRVPMDHQKKWGKYCARYDACGRPVLFVRDDWYLRDYAPAYRAKHGKGHGKGHGKPGKGHGGDDHGGGHGGKGHGKGH